MNYYLNDENAEETRRPIIENIISAHMNGDYDQLLKYDFGDLEKRLPRERFKQAAEKLFKSMGNATSIEYLGSLKKTDFGTAKMDGFLLL